MRARRGEDAAGTDSVSAGALVAGGAGAGAGVASGGALDGAPGGSAGLPVAGGCAGAAGAGFGVAVVVPAGAFSGPRPHATLQTSAASTRTSGSDRRGIAV